MTALRTISVAKLKKAGACRDYQRKAARLIGPKRAAPFTLDLAMHITLVLQRGEWFADYVLTSRQRAAYYEHMGTHAYDETWLDRERRRGQAIFLAYNGLRSLPND